MFLKNLLFNLFLISLTYTPSLVLNGFGIKPYHRGFYCDDESIRKPKLDHDQIGVALLIFLVAFPPILLISLSNWYSHNRFRCKQQEHGALKLSLNDIFLLFFGLGLVMILVDTSKYTIGRHRPNFYKSCEPRIPNWDENKIKTLQECHTLSKEARNSYIVDYECTSKALDNEIFKEDINLSFMSGHAATMMFSAIFVSIILGQRLRPHLDSTMGRLIVGSIIILEINLALFVGYTRVSDYRHHPTDVLTGFITGALMAIFIKFFIDKSSCVMDDNEIDVRPRVLHMKTIPNEIPEMV